MHQTKSFGSINSTQLLESFQHAQSHDSPNQSVRLRIATLRRAALPRGTEATGRGGGLGANELARG